MDPAGKKFGVEIANVSPTNYAKIKAMVEAKAVEWDLVDVGGQFIFQGRDQDLLEKMDFSIINVSKIDKAWVTDYGIFTSTGATVIAYNTRSFPEGKGACVMEGLLERQGLPRSEIALQPLLLQL